MKQKSLKPFPALVSATVLVLVSIATQAAPTEPVQHVAPSAAELQQQIEALREQVRQLQAQQHAPAAQPAVAPTGGMGMMGDMGMGMKPDDAMQMPSPDAKPMSGGMGHK